MLSKLNGVVKRFFRLNVYIDVVHSHGNRRWLRAGSIHDCLRGGHHRSPVASASGPDLVPTALSKETRCMACAQVLMYYRTTQDEEQHLAAFHHRSSSSFLTIPFVAGIFLERGSAVDRKGKNDQKISKSSPSTGKKALCYIIIPVDHWVI